MDFIFYLISILLVVILIEFCYILGYCLKYIKDYLFGDDSNE